MKDTEKDSGEMLSVCREINRLAKPLVPADLKRMAHSPATTSKVCNLGADSTCTVSFTIEAEKSSISLIFAVSPED